MPGLEGIVTAQQFWYTHYQHLNDDTESAVRIVAETVGRKAKVMSGINRSMPFFDEMAKHLLARELILNCLIIKDQHWAPEQEVRQFILGENRNLAPHVSMRSRGTEATPSVPYIKSNIPLHEPGCITEIIIGPAAPSDAEDFAARSSRHFTGTRAS
jgi:hypothetical protein